VLPGELEIVACEVALTSSLDINVRMEFAQDQLERTENCHRTDPSLFR
jgi:hypothetical protein